MNKLNIENYQSCTCNNHVDSSSVNFTEKYTGIGWFFWSMGTTMTPSQLTFTCLDCNKVFLTLIDKQLIKDYMLFRKK